MNSKIEISQAAANIEIKEVILSKDANFKLILLVENQSTKSKKLIFLSFIYKDIFYTKSYAEARYYIESLKIFADQKYADLDTKEFEIREKKEKNGKVNHSFFCKFIKNEKVYLSRATAKTIAAIFLESTFNYQKKYILEKRVGEFSTIFKKNENIPKLIQNKLKQEIKDIKKIDMSKELKESISTTLSNFYKNER